MRIISGTHRGKKLSPSKKLPVRPTTDMAKESLFNIINNHFYFDGLTVLDLFAGTGNISFEFASRGVIYITSVDIDTGCIKFIEKTSEEMKLDNIDIIKEDVFKFIRKTNVKAKLIFADPPFDFDQEVFESIPKIVFERDMLEENGMLIIEHFNKMDLSHLENFSFSRKYGASIFSFFEIEEEELSYSGSV